MKINISKIFKYVLITALNILCIFVLQYYINLQADISKSLSSLKIAIFINESEEHPQDEIINSISNYGKFTNMELVSSEDSEHFNNINPELESTIPKEAMVFPSFILANGININNLNELKSIKSDLLNFDYIEDVVYDQKAYKMFFDNRALLNKYKKIFKILFYLIIIIFVLKILFFSIKNLYKDILMEIGFGILSALCAYAIICLITIFNQETIFMLSGQVLYIIIPLSSMISLLTKESNV
ncbi:MAG: hypothetical protein J6T23_04805 [Elusimicrobia bacterium]|nr:hypothetical protein [Elusimicrobiota bacterium]